MGKRGPAPKPTARKQLEGTFRKDRAARDEFSLPPGTPDAPKWLDLEARAEWDRVVPTLVDTGILSKLDGGRLADYCTAHSLAIEATRIYQREGTVVDSPQGQKAHPAVVIAKDARAQARHLAAEFGLTPSGRSRVSVPPKPGESEKEIEEDLFGKPLEVVQGGKG
jgi:P27 family predicted phage terminase small subunit